MMHPGVGRIKNRADFSDADRGIVAQTRGDLDRRADQQRAKEYADYSGEPFHLLQTQLG